MYCFVVSLHKCWEKVYVSVRVLVDEVLLQFFANSALDPLDNRALHVGNFADLKLNSLAFQHALKCFV
jgi:hypothetical protein